MTIEEQDAGSVVRAFVALELPQRVREALSRIQAEMKQAGARVGWVAMDNMHLTLAFLGDTWVNTLPALQQALDEVAAGVEPFVFPVEGVGHFGSPREPRVIWAGIREIPRPMVHLNELLQQALSGLGYALENRPFKPHITLGRVRAARGLGALTSLLASVRNSAFGEVRVERLLLMRSHLDETPVRYSVLHESPLKGTTPHGS